MTDSLARSVAIATKCGIRWATNLVLGLVVRALFAFQRRTARRLGMSPRLAGAFLAEATRPPGPRLENPGYGRRSVARQGRRAFVVERLELLGVEHVGLT